VDAASVNIVHVTTLNPWGNETGLVYRGHPATLNLSLTSLSEADVQIRVTLIDVNSVAVAIANTNTIVTAQETMAIDLLVTSYAFVGPAQYSIVITDQASKLLTALTIPTYIELMGDFDSDGKVTSQDLLIFLDAFDYFDQYQEIPNQYKMCDLNNDKKIDFTDLVFFVVSYIDEGNLTPLL